MEDKIFSIADQDFEAMAIEVFHFQYHSNNVYRSWVDQLNIDPLSVTDLSKIPFLPISFFKTHKVTSGDFRPMAIFESSGTTGTGSSKHYVKNLALYRRSFLKGFDFFYGNPAEYAILGLLPSYLERQNSSLIVMVEELVSKSKHPASGFYLHDHVALEKKLLELRDNGQRIFLIGVSFALLDFAESHRLNLGDAIVMETGGMKGRRQELTRAELHQILETNLGVSSIHSEYGMTELLSQAYSKGGGIFQTPPWMKIVLRDEEDPLLTKEHSNQITTKGAINIIDLANLNSCSFIATDDLGSLTSAGFTVEGRLDISDLRGCSLLTV